MSANVHSTEKKEKRKEIIQLAIRTIINNDGLDAPEVEDALGMA